jgi:uncharacterized membrane protein
MMLMKKTNAIHPQGSATTTPSPEILPITPYESKAEAAAKTAAAKTAGAAKLAASKTAEAAKIAKERIAEAKKAADEVEMPSEEPEVAKMFEAVAASTPTDETDTAKPTNQPASDAEVFERNLKSAWLAYYPKHRNAIIYGGLGFIVAILILTAGFWPVLLVVLLTVAGTLYGRYQDGNVKVQTFFNHLFRRK